jgi:hypothetical protein
MSYRPDELAWHSLTRTRLPEPHRKVMRPRENEWLLLYKTYLADGFEMASESHRLLYINVNLTS